MRWRVGVDEKTGQPVLIKRYRLRELHGQIDELYNSGRDYLWYLDPSEESAEPSLQEMAAALEQVAHSRDQIRAAIQDYKTAIRSALTRNESVLDPDLPDALRERLFAIRGHLLGAP